MSGDGRRSTLAQAYFARTAVEVARDLLGATLLVDEVGGVIVETEAYDRHDPASHSFRGRTKRNAAMFGPPGHAYVYRSYGLHWCFNVVCGTEGSGSAVLIRAIEPQADLDTMRARRGVVEARLLCAGPGRLCAALGITGDLDGHALDRPPFRLTGGAGPVDIMVGPRIGLTQAAGTPWRFGIAGSPFLSRRFPPT